MGTKNHPGTYDCYERAEPDEPMFVLLARDESAPALVREWANRRLLARPSGADAAEIEAQVAEARQLAVDMVAWRSNNPGPLPRPLIPPLTVAEREAFLAAYHLGYCAADNGDPDNTDGDGATAMAEWVAADRPDPTDREDG